MTIAAIDPGKSGALFIFEPEVPGLSTVADVPLQPKKIAGKKNPRMIPNFDQWWDEWLKLLSDPAISDVFIEDVGGSSNGKGQAQVGMFAFGRAAGFAYGICKAAGCRVHFITPQAWKKVVGLKGSDGNESRERASQLLPGCDSFWPLVKHDGRAEAALIAFVGVTKLKENESGISNDDGRRDHHGATRAARRGRKQSEGSGGDGREGNVVQKPRRGSKAKRADGGQSAARSSRSRTRRPKARSR